jgi:hypothetical protein
VSSFGRNDVFFGLVWKEDFSSLLGLVDGEGDGFCVADGAAGCSYGVGVGSGWGGVGIGGFVLDAPDCWDADGEQQGEKAHSTESEFAEAAAARGEVHQ